MARYIVTLEASVAEVDLRALLRESGMRVLSVQRDYALRFTLPVESQREARG